jgi:two-component system, response regulator
MSPSALLIVEDNEDDLFLLKRSLERARVTNAVHSVRTGAELTKYLMGLGPYRDRGLHPLPGLIFLDLKLADMQGTDVLRFLNGQKDFGNITVVVWTAGIGPADAHEVKDLQIKCCVIKPHSQETLNETVRGLNHLLAVQGLPAVLEFDQRS